MVDWEQTASLGYGIKLTNPWRNSYSVIMRQLFKTLVSWLGIEIGFQAYLCYSLAWPWTSHWTLLCLNFFLSVKYVKLDGLERLLLPWIRVKCETEYCFGLNPKKTENSVCQSTYFFMPSVQFCFVLFEEYHPFVLWSKNRRYFGISQKNEW